LSASNVCPACGAVNGATDLFCVNCGTRLGMPTAAALPPAYSTTPPGYPAPPPGYPPAPGMPGPGGTYPYPPAPPPRRATFSTILSALFDVWTKNFVNFFIVFLGVALVNGLIGGLLSFAILNTFESGSSFIPGVPFTASAATIAALLLYAIVAAVAAVIINSIVVGGMTEYAVRRYRGEAMTLEQALRRGLQRFLSIFAANILLTILIVALVLLPLILLLPAVGLAGTGNVEAAFAVLCGAAIAFVVGGVIALYVYVAMSLFAPAIMIENQGAVAGLMRSWRITKGYRWSLFGAILVTVILSAVISGVITFPAGLTGNPIVNIGAGALASGIVGAWYVILAAVAYDLITRPTPYGPPPSYPGSFGAPPMGAPPSPPSPPPPTPPGTGP